MLNTCLIKQQGPLLTLPQVTWPSTEQHFQALEYIYLADWNNGSASPLVSSVYSLTYVCHELAVVLIVRAEVGNFRGQFSLVLYGLANTFQGNLIQSSCHVSLLGWCLYIFQNIFSFLRLTHNWGILLGQSYKPYRKTGIINCFVFQECNYVKFEPSRYRWSILIHRRIKEGGLSASDETMSPKMLKTFT